MQPTARGASDPKYPYNPTNVNPTVLQLVPTSTDTVMNNDYNGTGISDAVDKMKDHQNQKSEARIAVNVSLFVNILLFCTKIYVYIDSFSLSVLVSLVDSIMDLLAQSVIYFTERNMLKQHSKYPAGRTRLEPIGIMTVSTLMIVSTIFIIRESAQALIAQHHLNDFNYFAIGSMSSVIILKFFCWLFCRSFKGQPIALVE